MIFIPIDFELSKIKPKDSDRVSYGPWCRQLRQRPPGQFTNGYPLDVDRSLYRKTGFETGDLLLVFLVVIQVECRPSDVPTDLAAEC